MKNIQKSIKISVLSIGLMFGFCAQAMGTKAIIPAKLAQSSAVNSAVAKAQAMAKTATNIVGNVTPVVVGAAQLAGLVDPTFAAGVMVGRIYMGLGQHWTMDAVRTHYRQIWHVPSKQDSTVNSGAILDQKTVVCNQDVAKEETARLMYQDQYQIMALEPLTKAYGKMAAVTVPVVAAVMSHGGPASEFATGIDCGALIGLCAGYKSYMATKEKDKNVVGTVPTTSEQKKALGVTPKSNEKLSDQVTK